MRIQKYFSEIGTLGVRALAAKAGTHYVYLYQIRSGHRKASPKMARKIVEASAGNLTLHDVRPDIWRRGEQ